MCYCICLRNGKGRSFGKIRNRRFFGSRTTSEKALIDRDLLQGHDPDVNVINENDYTGKVKAEGKIGLRHAIISAIQGMTLKQLEALNVDAVINLKNDTKIAGINVFNEEYKLTDDAKKLVKKDGVDLSKYIEKETLKGLKIGDVTLFNEEYKLTKEAAGLVNKDGYISKEELEKDYIKKEEIKGLEIAGVKLFNEENYKLTDEANGLVKKEDVTGIPGPSTTPHAGGCCRY